MRYHLTPVRMAIIEKPTITNAGEGVEKREPLRTVGQNVNWYNPYGKEYGSSWKNWKQNYPMIRQSHFWVYTCPKEMKTLCQRDICTLMLIAALFTIAKTWKQPKCPLTDEWIKALWIIHNWILFSQKKKEILPFGTTWMDTEGIMLSEISHTKANIVWSHLCVESKKNQKNQKSWKRRLYLWLPEAKGGGGEIGWRWPKDTHFQL